MGCGGSGEEVGKTSGRLISIVYLTVFFWVMP